MRKIKAILFALALIAATGVTVSCQEEEIKVVECRPGSEFWPDCSNSFKP